MKPDDLDRILSSESPLTPSSAFVGEVMSSIQAQGSLRFLAPFPWIPFLMTLLPLAILSVQFLPADPLLRVMSRLTGALAEWTSVTADPAVKSAILSVSAALLGSLALVRLSLRLTGTGR